MRERRLLEEAQVNRFERRLLRAARADAMPGEVREQLLERLRMRVDARVSSDSAGETVEVGAA
jgi:hypothetical protein